MNCLNHESSEGSHVLNGQVQEVQLNTNLNREGIKAAVQRVTGRVP